MKYKCVSIESRGRWLANQTNHSTIHAAIFANSYTQASPVS